MVLLWASGIAYTVQIVTHPWVFTVYYDTWPYMSILFKLGHFYSPEWSSKVTEKSGKKGKNHQNSNIFENKLIHSPRVCKIEWGI